MQRSRSFDCHLIAGYYIHFRSLSCTVTHCALIVELTRCKGYLELLSCFLHSVPVLTIDNIDETICVIKIMPPEWSQFLLPTNIPDGEENIFVLDLFDVEPCQESALSAGAHNTSMHKSLQVEKQIAFVSEFGFQRALSPMVGTVLKISPICNL